MSDFDLNVSQSVARALAEDVGKGDVTAALLPEKTRAQAKLLLREAAMICGIPWFNECFRQVDANCEIEWLVDEGALLSANTELCIVQGPARGILTAERTALNFLQTLSATATLSHRYVEASGSSQSTILDTRKTLPGLRREQKYACKVGGAENHRMGLYDAILIKENHILAHGSIASVMQAAQTTFPELPVEIEVESLQELEQALDAGAKRILLDNFSIAMLQQAVELNQGLAKLEASGGVDLQHVAQIAATGVDFISIGDLTKNIKAVDYSLRISLHE